MILFALFLLMLGFVTLSILISVQFGIGYVVFVLGVVILVRWFWRKSEPGGN